MFLYIKLGDIVRFIVKIPQISRKLDKIYNKDIEIIKMKDNTIISTITYKKIKDEIKREEKYSKTPFILNKPLVNIKEFHPLTFWKGRAKYTELDTEDKALLFMISRIEELKNLILKDIRTREKYLEKHININLEDFQKKFPQYFI